MYKDLRPIDKVRVLVIANSLLLHAGNQVAGTKCIQQVDRTRGSVTVWQSSRIPLV